MASIIMYKKEDLEKYLNDLKLIGSLSSLFSSNDIPMLHYRISEYIYCTSFNAKNIAKDDVSADAVLKSIGIGIKTFIKKNQKTFEKIAEFNAQSFLYANLSLLDKIKKIGELRNKRLEFTKSNYNFNSLIYHCIVRSRNGFHLFEENMEFIDINNLRLTKAKKHIYYFSDGISEYQFNESKSTLYKRFISKEYFASINVQILENPMEELRKLNLTKSSPIESSEILVLPLYSYTKNNKKIVRERSGLNLWNAKGRKRNIREVYLSFPAEVRKFYKDYFPNRDNYFEVLLPNNKIFTMSVCQENGKALMSNPNKDLGNWLLKDVLKIEDSTLITYDMLLEIGIDAVIFEKKSGKYSINFAEVGKYEEFLKTNLNTNFKNSRV